MGSRSRIMRGARVYECPDWCVGGPEEAEARRHLGPWSALLVDADLDGLATSVEARPWRDWFTWEAVDAEVCGVEYMINPMPADLAGWTFTHGQAKAVSAGLDQIAELAAQPHGWVWAYNGADNDQAIDWVDYGEDVG